MLAPQPFGTSVQNSMAKTDTETEADLGPFMLAEAEASKK
jgi:hypothetical protein